MVRNNLSKQSTVEKGAFSGQTMMGTVIEFDWENQNAFVDGEQVAFEENLERAREALRNSEFERMMGDSRPLFE